MGFLNDDGVLYLWEKIKAYVASSKVSKTSQLTNDSGFITSHQDISGKVDKTEFDTKYNAAGAAIDSLTSLINTKADASAVNDALSNITSIHYIVVPSLPSVGLAGYIYLIAHNHGDKDIYDEYIYVDGKYEKIGNTDIDLSGYVTKDALNTAITPISNNELETICV